MSFIPFGWPLVASSLLLQFCSDQSEEKAESKPYIESETSVYDYPEQYEIYFPEEDDPEFDYGSESVYHYR